MPLRRSTMTPTGMRASGVVALTSPPHDVGSEGRSIGFIGINLSDVIAEDQIDRLPLDLVKDDGRIAELQSVKADDLGQVRLVALVSTGAVWQRAVLVGTPS